MNVSVGSRISSAVIDSQRSSILRVSSEKNSKDAESDYHDSAQVLYGGCARAQPREAQVSLRSKYVCVCVCARERVYVCVYVLDRQPRGCNGTSQRCRLCLISRDRCHREKDRAKLRLSCTKIFVIESNRKSVRVVNKHPFHSGKINHDRFIFTLIG